MNTFDEIAQILGVPESNEPPPMPIEIEDVSEAEPLNVPEGYSLRYRILDMTHALFDKWGHGPSSDHWKGLGQIAATYESMATGQFGSVQKNYRYMSSLPPGMGKTTVAIQGTKALLADPEFEGVGVIYFLSRLDEIRTLAALMDLPKVDFAAITSDPEINALGNPVPERARVLFTTQQRLEAFSKNGTPFADMKELRYRGRPRQVRIWDEAILPSMALTIGELALLRLPLELQPVSPELSSEIKGFALSLKDHAGDRITMPDIDKTGTDLDTFRSYFAHSSDKDIAEQFWYLSGHVVRVRRDDYSGNITLGYEDILPPDLAPMLILDASGGLRKTYRFWEDDRGELYRLHSPQKSYAGLTIHHWNKGAGKKKQRAFKTVAEIADGVVKMVAEVPEDEPVLIVHHKVVGSGKHQPDIVKAIERKLPRRSGRVHFVNWGRHTATNEFKDVRFVILAGTLQYDPASYEAMGRGAKKASVDDDFSKNDFVETRIGEISHHIFQAAGRGSIRKTVNGGCPADCHLYPVFSSRGGTGFPVEQLKVIFPDAIVSDWQPGGENTRTRLTGRVRQAVEFIVSVVNAMPGAIVTTKEVKDYLGISKQNCNDLTRHADFMPALRIEGIVLDQGPGKPGVFQRQNGTDRNEPNRMPSVGGTKEG